MDPKDWWLTAVAATSMMTPLAEAATQPGDRVGVVTAARPQSRNAVTSRVVYVGNDVVFGERFATDSSGIIHILFMDQSSITLGPNSEVTIDEFIYHPDKQPSAAAANVQIKEPPRESITVNLVKGFLRVVGGLISKRSPTRITTETATVGVRGGITLVEASAGQTKGIFLFGHEMQMTTRDGQHSRSITRPGFGLTGSAVGIDDPVRIPVADFAGLLGQFESRPPVAARDPGTGQLLSTSDRPIGVATPDATLALDRLDKTVLEMEMSEPRSALRELLGSTTDARVQS